MKETANALGVEGSWADECYDLEEVDIIALGMEYSRQMQKAGLVPPKDNLGGSGPPGRSGLGHGLPPEISALMVPREQYEARIG